MSEIAFEILHSIACLSEEKSGWRKELNLISWNGGKPKYDIRDWAPEHKYDLRSWSEDHSKMGKGITLSDAELSALKDALNEL